MPTTPKRQQIREAAKAMLLGHTEAGQNVYSNRVSALWRSDLPSISIYLTDETATPRDLRQSSYVRTGTLVFQILAAATENLDHQLDTIADQIESITGADPSLKGTVQGFLLQSSESELNTEGTTPIGTLSLIYQVTYIK